MGERLTEVSSDCHVKAAGKRGIAEDLEEITRFHKMRLQINGWMLTLRSQGLKVLKHFCTVDRILMQRSVFQTSCTESQFLQSFGVGSKIQSAA